MRCPFCESTLGHGAITCPDCGLRLARDPSGQMRPFFPQIRPGEVLCAFDFRRDPLPGRKDRSPFDYKDGSKRYPLEEGIALDTKTAGHFEFILKYLRIRDCIIRAQWVARTPGTEAFVGLRYQKLDEMDVGYRLTLRPDTSEYRIVRIASSTKVASTTRLVDATKHPYVAPLGRPNVVELGAQGPTLQATLNGMPVWSVHDPILGIGSPVIGGGLTGEGVGSVVFHWLEVRAVAP